MVLVYLSDSKKTASGITPPCTSSRREFLKFLASCTLPSALSQHCANVPAVAVPILRPGQSRPDLEGIQLITVQEGLEAFVFRLTDSLRALYESTRANPQYIQQSGRIRSTLRFGRFFYGAVYSADHFDLAISHSTAAYPNTNFGTLLEWLRNNGHEIGRVRWCVEDLSDQESNGRPHFRILANPADSSGEFISHWVGPQSQVVYLAPTTDLWLSPPHILYQFYLAALLEPGVPDL